MNKKFFKEAEKQALKSDYQNKGTSKSIKIGAVAVFKKSIIAKGCNQNKTHPLQNRYNYLRFKQNNSIYFPDKIHAEMDIISKIQHLDIDFKNVEIYIYRQMANGTSGMARPCPSCLKALVDLGIKKIYYSTEYGYCKEILI